jgi:hypothetical protein
MSDDVCQPEIEIVCLPEIEEEAIVCQPSIREEAEVPSDFPTWKDCTLEDLAAHLQKLLLSDLTEIELIVATCACSFAAQRLGILPTSLPLPGDAPCDFDPDGCRELLTDLRRRVLDAAIPAPTPILVSTSASPQGATVNARMFDLMSRNHEAYGWSQKRFAEILDCTPNAVAKTAAWDAIMRVREGNRRDRKERHR